MTTDTQALPNHGYSNAGPNPVQVTLPPSATLVVGDVIRVASNSTGSFLVMPQVDQVLLYHPIVIPGGAVNVPGGSFTTGAATKVIPSPRGVAASQGGGVEVVGSTAAGGLGQIAVSTDSWVADVNLTFSSTGRNRNVVAVAVNGDGTYRVAAEGNAGSQAWAKVNFFNGTTWSQQPAADAQTSWAAVAMGTGTGDASKRYVAAETSGLLWISDAPTGTPTLATTNLPVTARSWAAVAMSADSNRVAAVENTGFTSSIWGCSAISRGCEAYTPSPTSQTWTGIAVSNNGAALAATSVNGIWVSADTGATFTQHAAGHRFAAVICDPTCAKIAALETLPATGTVTGSRIWWSYDSGAYWAVAPEMARILEPLSGAGLVSTGGATPTLLAFDRTLGKPVLSATPVDPFSGVLSAVGSFAAVNYISYVEFTYFGDGQFVALTAYAPVPELITTVDLYEFARP